MRSQHTQWGPLPSIRMCGRSWRSEVRILRSSVWENGVAVDYAMNTLCAAGTGAFLSSQAHRLGVKVEDFGKIALSAKRAAPVAARCTVFAESDLVHKLHGRISQRRDHCRIVQSSGGQLSEQCGEGQEDPSSGGVPGGRK